MPGGGPAGTTLGLLMFIVLINNTADPGDKQAWGQLLTASLKGRTPVQLTHAKLMDDTTLGESIDLDKSLIRPNEAFWDRPVPYRSRYYLTLPDHANLTNTELSKMADYADRIFMEINIKKTKVLLFNKKRRRIDFLPSTELREQILDVVDEIRLVGLVISDDLTWTKNTDSITK